MSSGPVLLPAEKTTSSDCSVWDPLECLRYRLLHTQEISKLLGYSLTVGIRDAAIENPEGGEGADIANRTRLAVSVLIRCKCDRPSDSLGDLVNRIDQYGAVLLIRQQLGSNSLIESRPKESVFH